MVLKVDPKNLESNLIVSHSSLIQIISIVGLAERFSAKEKPTTTDLEDALQSHVACTSTSPPCQEITSVLKVLPTFLMITI